MNEYKICTRCIMDTSDNDIRFDEKGICNHCKEAEELLSKEPYSLSKLEKNNLLQKLINTIKKSSKEKKYDCIIGVSGGVDSSYVAYLTKKFGLRPLAVHLDNGWNSELANNNINKICDKLGIDLYTYVIDWEEFKDIQYSFLKASVPDCEIPTDHAIVSLLYNLAGKYGLKYILGGTNLSTESIMPREWSQGHGDWKYIKGIQQRFGSKKIKSFPHRGIIRIFYNVFIKRIKWINFLDYIDYIKNDAKNILSKEIDWQDYGGKHYESLYTKIFQAHFLPTKFGFDKRRGIISSLIVSNQISRDEALNEIAKPLYNPKELKKDIDYLCKKFGITVQEFEKIMQMKPKNFSDYHSYQKIWYFRILKKIRDKLKIKSLM